MNKKQYVRLSISCIFLFIFGTSLYGHNISWNKATITVKNDVLTISLRVVQIDLLGATRPGKDSTRIRSHDEWVALLPEIRSYVFGNTHVTIDDSPLSEIISDSWNVENAPSGNQTESGTALDTVMGMITLSRTWKINPSPRQLSWRSDIFGVVDIPVKWVVLISAGSTFKKRMYTVVNRGETAVYDFIGNSWENSDGMSISSGDESTLWGKVKQLVTVGFSGINLEKIFSSSGNPKLMIVFLLVAVLIGAFHALSPGHGKALIGAYIIGTKGTIKDAVTLGVVTALSHTLSVLILGVVLLLVFDAVVPPTVMTYIKVTSGALIVVIGVILFRQRWHVLTAHHKPEHGNSDIHNHGHDHDHGHGQLHHNHTHEKHNHLSTGHSHDHHHISMESIRKKGFCTNVIMGISGGMVPCPTALVVLFLAVSLQKLVLGVLLILFFSLGLAVTLTVLGILFAKGSKLIEKYDDNGIVSRLPAVSAGIIILVGLGIMVRAVVPA